MSNQITLRTAQSLVPNGASYVDQSFVDKINSLMAEEDDVEAIRDSLMESFCCLSRGYSAEQFYKAVKFVSLLNAGKSITDSYIITFPERSVGFEEKNIKTHISNYASNYNTTKIVKEIKKHLLIPTHLLFRDVKYKAIYVLSEMLDNKTVPAKTKVLAANTLLTHLKDPDEGKLTLSVNYENDNVINALRQSMIQLVSKQQESLIVGTDSLASLGARKITDDNEEDY